MSIQTGDSVEIRHAAVAASTELAAWCAPQLEPATQAFIDGLRGTPPLYTLAPEAARAALAALAADEGSPARHLQPGSHPYRWTVRPNKHSSGPAGGCRRHLADDCLHPRRWLGVGRQGHA